MKFDLSTATSLLYSLDNEAAETSKPTPSTHLKTVRKYLEDREAQRVNPRNKKAADVSGSEASGRKVSWPRVL